MKREKNKGRVIYSKFVFGFALFLFAACIFKLSYLVFATEVDGMDLKKFANSRNTAKETIYAGRGTIYDSNNNALAQNIASYTVIAYLSESRGEGNYVKDKEKTARLLAPVLNMKESTLLELLNKSLYQVELGPGGRDIGPIVKDQVEALKLEGIDFTESYKRYYPSGDYASYTIGSAKKNEDGNIQGVMGIEMYYNDILTGTNGYREYQKDLYGIKIPNTYERLVEPIDGSDIYLTLDTNVQLFVEQAAKEIDKKSNPDWFVMIVADAKTGAILGTTSTPSFDPNDLGTVQNWLNPVTSYPYEPGSTMKIYSFMAAIEKGTYDGKAKVKSGQLKVGKDIINDWNKKGWGTITFDYGFAQSSNVAASSLVMDQYIAVEDLRELYQKLGFGATTGINLPRESAGQIEIRNDKISQLNATFGQGITTTAIQNVQALTVISNNGVMLKPYIIDKIVDASGDITYQGSKEESGRIVSVETINKLKDLMYDVVHNDWEHGTGYMYKVDGFDIIGKTGTAQIADTVYGGYLTGENDYVKSFAGMFPKDNPEIIVYAAIKKGVLSNTYMSQGVKEVIRNTAKHLNIFRETNTETMSKYYTLTSYVNKATANVKKELETQGLDVVVIGTGDKVISQYPKTGSKMWANEKIFLLTNKEDAILPSFYKWSKKDVANYCDLLNITCTLNGTGYVSKQSLPKGTKVDKTTDIIFTFQSEVEL